MISLKELPNGNLLIISNERAYLEQMIKESKDERATLDDMLDMARYIGNNWSAPTEIGLTEAPAVAWGLEYNDEGELYDYEKLWYYSNYMIDSFLEILNRDGRVEFTRYRE